MRADLDDPARFDIEDFVRAADRRKPVRDDQRGAPRQELVERRFDQPFGMTIERAGRFVQDQDAWIAQHGARDRDALPLAAREPHAAIADRRVVALRQVENELFGVRFARRHLDLGPRRVEPAVTDIFADRSAEQQRLLRHDRDRAAQRGQLDARDIDAVECDPAGLRLVEARYEIDDGGLPRARWTDERDDLAGLDLPREIAQDGRIG